jgi:tetratricopeptide (TPR) repeat protein
LEATEEFTRAEIAFREGNCASDAAWMLNWQGRCWLERDSEKAVGYYKQAMVEFRTAGEQGVLGVAKNGVDLGTTLLGLSRFDEASAVLAEAVKGYKKLEMPGEVGWALRLQGLCWLERDSEKAVGYYNRAIVEFRTAGEQEVYVGASTCVELGKLLLRLRRFDEASAVFGEAASDYEKLASPDNAAWMLYWRGNCWADRDDAKAVALYSQALTLSRGFSEDGVEGVSGVAVYGTALGKAKFRLQRFEEAAELFQEAAKLGIDCAQKNLHAARRAAWAGDAFFRSGNLAASAECFAQADKLYAHNDLPNARIALGMSILTSNAEVAREDFSAVRSCPAPREQQFQPDACLALCLVSLHERMTGTQPVDLDEREQELLREAVLTKADGPPRDLQLQRRLAHLLHASKDLSQPLRDAVRREILMLLPADSELRHVYDGR